MDPLAIASRNFKLKILHDVDDAILSDYQVPVPAGAINDDANIQWVIPYHLYQDFS